MFNLIKQKRIKNLKLYSNRLYSTSTNEEAKLKEKFDTSNIRINEVGVQMINEKLRSYLFDKSNQKSPDLIEKSRKHLEKFNLNTKKLHPLPDIDEFELPKLKGKNIEEHFLNIGREQIDAYTKLISVFASNGIPKMPKRFNFTSGWTKYDSNTNEFVKVEYPDDDVLVFDVECLVLYQNCPVIGVAVSSNAWYSWCSDRLIQNDFLYLSSLQFNDLIPLEPKDSSERSNRKRIIIGHNVGFDRSFIREQYYLKKSAMRFWDTMSMHIACYGYTSEQRAILLNEKLEGPEQVNNDKKRNYNFSKKFSFVRSTEKNYQWKNVGSLNSLKDVHKKHCPLGDSVDKDSRSFFVKGKPEDIIENFQMLMNYCANDVLATYEVFTELFPTFLVRFPHPVTIAGMLEMSTMYLPINQNWLKYIENCENAFEDSQYVLKKLLEKSADEACKFMDHKNDDPWLFDLDWDTKDLKLVKNGAKSKTTSEDLISSLIMNDNQKVEENPFYKVSSKEAKSKIDNLDKSLEFDKSTYNSLLTAKNLPKNISNLYNYPNWYKDLCCKMDDSDWQPSPSNITTKTRVTPNLLRLTWNGYPLHHHSKFGWGYLIPKVEYEENQKKSELIKSEKNSSKKSKPKKEAVVILINDDKVFQKIPHKDGNDLNVGNPLSKSFLSKINEGIMSSIPEKSAGLALKFYTNISYWENNEKRIKSQKAIWLNEVQEKYSRGAILPITAVAGTITRRAVEPTWLTASNFKKERIGGELKTMIQSPLGYSLIGADVDSQELWIASTIGDAHFAKIHGSTALGWMNLQGKKSDGTDMHSVTASMIGISRDQAKVFNYGRIYGAGRTFAEKLLLQFNPTMSEEEAGKKARTMYAQTKGKRLKSSSSADKNANNQSDDKNENDNENDLSRKWVDGTESEMFNKLEEIARSSLPKTPVLNAAITKTLEPANVSDEFMTSRINWVVQSSAVDYLHIMLVCMNWLIEKYDIDARFVISIHDEIRYLVKEEDKFRAALALQITNLYTRALFSYKLGFDDLPFSVAFFSAVDIDRCLRKEPDLEFITPSNPNGLTKGYGIPKGTCMDIYQIIEKTNGKLSKF